MNCVSDIEIKLNQVHFYYSDQIEACESASSLTESMTSMSISSTTPTNLLAPGEVLKPSGKFSKPTRIPGKNYCKDEVVIRNADSGKGEKDYPNGFHVF